jgi:hypothetical protein
MESVNSCIFLSQFLSCLTSSSSVFPLITISSLSSEILSCAYSSLLEPVFLRFSISWFTSSLILSIFILSSFISQFMVFFVSLWCLYRASIVSFICSCAFSYSLFLLFWNFLSVSCTFWLTLSSIILWNSLWLLAGFLLSDCSCVLRWVLWYSLSLFCWSLNVGICFLHFPPVPVLTTYWGGKMVSIFFLSSHHSTWCCYCPCTVCNLVLSSL